MNKCVTDRKGFTLIELAVVIAIMAALVGLLSPLLYKYVEKSKESTDLTNAETAYAAATVYYSSSDGHIPSKLYFNGNDVVESNAGIIGYGKSKKPFADFIPEGFPITNVGGTPMESEPNYIIITMGPDGVEGLGWGVEVAAIFADGTPKYSNRIFTAPEWEAASKEEKVSRDIELFNSLEAAASEMTYGELLTMAREQGLFESDYAGNVCIKLASSNIFKSDHSVGDKGAETNEIYAKELFRRAGYDTSLSKEETYIVTSRVGGATDVWIDLGHTADEILHDTNLFNSKAADVIVYGEGEGEKFDDGALDHTKRALRKML